MVRKNNISTLYNLFGIKNLLLNIVEKNII